jgi:hypothetical protein
MVITTFLRNQDFLKIRVKKAHVLEDTKDGIFLPKDIWSPYDLLAYVNCI